MLHSAMFYLCVFVCSVYSGHHTYLMSPYDVELNPALWLHVLSTNKSEYCMLEAEFCPHMDTWRREIFEEVA